MCRNPEGLGRGNRKRIDYILLCIMRAPLVKSTVSPKMRSVYSDTAVRMASREQRCFDMRSKALA